MMRSYTVAGFCDPLVPVDHAEPEARGTEVIVEVQCCGVCHSDLHLQDGYYDLGGGKRLSLADRGIKPPLVMGHEVLGRLIAIGPDAPMEKDAIGKTFLVYPWLGCGRCDVCRRDEENLCATPASIGVFRAGGYADKCVVPHPKYLVDVSGLEPALAATYACSGLTAYSALRKVSIDPANDLLLMMGFGGVGMSCLQIAQGLGYRNIAVAELDAAKRDLALCNGAAIAIDPGADGAGTILAEAGGVAAAIDLVGSSKTAEFAIAALRKAGSYIAVGLFGGDVTLALPPLVQRSITVRGSYVGNLKELKELIALAKSGKVPPLPVETLAFAQVNHALDRLRGGQVQGRLVLAR